MTEMEKSEAMKITAPPSSETLRGSIGGKAGAAESIVTERTVTPSSMQTSEGSSVEKAIDAEVVPYLKGWRLHFLSVRSVPLDHSRYFSDRPTAWLFCSSLSTSKSQSSEHP